MTKPNQASRYVWNWQGATGQCGIEATGQSFEFGEYSKACDKWTAPSMITDVLPYGHYDHRFPHLTPLKRELSNIKHSWHPTSIQFLNFSLHDYATGSEGGTGFVQMQPLNNGMATPISIRHEEIEGTNPRLIQACDAYCVNTHVRIMDDNPMMVTCEFAWGKKQDHNDLAFLTRDPEALGFDEGAYHGRPEVFWGATGYQIDAWKVEFDIKQNFEKTTYKEASGQRVYLYNYQPINLMINAVFDENNSWQDFSDRNIKNILVRAYKPKREEYIELLFMNCNIINWTKTGYYGEGHYEELAIFKADSCTGWQSPFTVGQATGYFKGELT